MSLPEPEGVTPREGWYWSEFHEAYLKPGTHWHITRCRAPSYGGWDPTFDWGACQGRYGRMVSFYATPEDAMQTIDEGDPFESPLDRQFKETLKLLEAKLEDAS